MAGTDVKTPWHLWLVGIIAVLFNSIGVFDFTMNMIQGSDYMKSAGMTPEQIGYYRSLSPKMMLVWAVGVFAAFIASILLLLRRRAAFAVFVLSLAAFLVNLLHMYVLSDSGAVMGRQMAVTNVVITVLLIAFTGYARAMTARGILR